MQISNQFVNTTSSRSSTTSTRVCFCFRFFSLCFALVRAFFQFQSFFDSFFLFSAPFFSLFLKHTKDYRKYNSQIVIFISALYFIVNICLVIGYVSIVIRCDDQIKKESRSRAVNQLLQFSQKVAPIFSKIAQKLLKSCPKIQKLLKSCFQFFSVRD